MSYDYSKLTGKIKEVCGKQSEFAIKMGWSERTASLKLNCIRDWKQSEMEKACDILGFDIVEIPIYFFTPLVQN